MECCCWKSPWCTPSLVRIGTHLVHFLMSRRQIFSIKSIKNSKIDDEMNTAWEGRESKSSNFVESCCRRSPWCSPSLVRIGSHLVHFLMSKRQIFSIKSLKNSKIDNEMNTARERGESKSWNFMESCCRRSPWCPASLVRIGTHLLHF